MATIRIPTPLRAYTDQQAAVAVTGTTVAEALQSLIDQHEGIGRHLRDDSGKLRSFVNIYLGEEDIRFLQQEQTPVAEDTELTIVPSIAGGAA